MTDRPIIFSGSMVRALIEGRKTMTRRLVPMGSVWMRVLVGDRLWVREAFFADGPKHVLYRASHSIYEDDPHSGWRPSIHMPRWASRLTLIVTATRLERLQDISKADVIAEGIAERHGYPLSDVHAGWHEPFAALWESLHGHGSWADNPEIVAITSRVIHANIDAPEAKAA